MLSPPDNAWRRKQVRRRRGAYVLPQNKIELKLNPSEKNLMYDKVDS